jgi:hypothetical protein
MELKANLRYFESREPTVYWDHIPPPRIRFFDFVEYNRNKNPV